MQPHLLKNRALYSRNQYKFASKIGFKTSTKSLLRILTNQTYSTFIYSQKAIHYLSQKILWFKTITFLNSIYPLELCHIIHEWSSTNLSTWLLRLSWGSVQMSCWTCARKGISHARHKIYLSLSTRIKDHALMFFATTQSRNAICSKLLWMKKTRN